MRPPIHSIRHRPLGGLRVDPSTSSNKAKSRPFVEARAFAQTLKLASSSAWRDLLREWEAPALPQIRNGAVADAVPSAALKRKQTGPLRLALAQAPRFESCKRPTGTDPALGCWRGSLLAM